MHKRTLSVSEGKTFQYSVSLLCGYCRRCLAEKQHQWIQKEKAGEGASRKSASPMQTGRLLHSTGGYLQWEAAMQPNLRGDRQKEISVGTHRGVWCLLSQGYLWKLLAWKSRTGIKLSPSKNLVDLPQFYLQTFLFNMCHTRVMSFLWRVTLF